MHRGVFGISDFYADGRLDRAGSIPNLTAGEAKAAVSLRGMVDPRRATVELHPLMRFFPCWLLARVLSPVEDGRLIATFAYVITKSFLECLALPPYVI